MIQGKNNYHEIHTFEKIENNNNNDAEENFLKSADSNK